MKKVNRLLLAFFVMCIALFSCEKDNFSEKDALDAQLDLYRTNELLRDSLLKVGGKVIYTINVLNGGDAAFLKSPKSNGLSGVAVTTSQLGLVQTKQTDETGMVVFDDLRIGKVTANISLSGYTSVSFIAELTPDPVLVVTQNTIRSCASQVPLFPLSGASTTTISGKISYESDLTNGTPEFASNLDVSASIDVTGTFGTTYINTSGVNGTGQIIKITYGEAVVRTQTDGNGSYTLTVPTTANGLPIRLNVADLAINQTLLANTLFGKNVFGIQSVRTLFTQNVTASTIPSVIPAYVTFGAPTGTTFGSAPTTAATAEAVISKGQIESINITNAGEGYTQTPTVKITGDGTGAAATATLTNGRISGIEVSSVGQNYTTASVSLTETGGDDATATAVLRKKVTEISLTNGGSGYSAAPTVTITGDGSGATAEANMSGYVNEITVTNPGSGFTKIPTILISGGSGSGATAKVYLTTGILKTITVPGNANAWYITAPTVAFANTGGVENPVATAIIDDIGRIAGLTFTPGSGYVNPPTITFSNSGGAPGSGAIAVAVLGSGGSVANIVIVNKGSGYSASNPPTVAITAAPGGGTSATITNVYIERRITSVNISNHGAGFVYGTTNSSFDGTDVYFNGNTIDGTEITLNRSISSISVNNSGSGYTSVPTISIVGDGTDATATALLKYSIVGVTVTNKGSGYNNTPTVLFTGDGSGAVASATLGDSYISQVVLGNPGSGYTAAPIVEITKQAGDDDPEINAVVTATVSGGEVTGFTISNAGKNYENTPNVTIKTYKTAATGNVNLNSGSVVAVNVTAPGLGYSVAPIVEFVSTSGSGAAATAVLDAQGRVERIDVTNAGNGYITAPTVNLVIPLSASTATGHVVVNSKGIVTSVVVDDGGDGYIAVPSVTITPSVTGVGSGAIAIAKISGGKVTSVTVTNGGTGYLGKNTPGNFFPDDANSISGVDFTFSQPTGANLTMKSGIPVINDIYLGTGKRTVEQ